MRIVDKDQRSCWVENWSAKHLRARPFRADRVDETAGGESGSKSKFVLKGGEHKQGLEPTKLSPKTQDLEHGESQKREANRATLFPIPRSTSESRRKKMACPDSTPDPAEHQRP